MAKLARLRFVNLGHEDARIDDLTLAFRDDTGRAVDSTIWLRNGGGKSSILNLFFSLVQPDRRQFLGGKAEFGDRQLEEYIARDDHGVIVAEWELPSDQVTLSDGLLLPERYLTGVFYEWKAGRNGEEVKLDRLFFAARVDERTPELTLEGIPVFATDDSGIVCQRVMASFRAEWLALRARVPHAGVGTYDRVKEWEEVLDHIGLDPDLFRYQVRMNVQEGGADQLFSFGSVEAFVDFFLELALNPAVGDQITANILTFRDDLRRRARELVPERALVESLLLRLQPLRAVSARRGTLRQIARDLRRDIWHLERHADRSLAAVAADVATQQQMVQEAETEAVRLDSSADQQSRRAAAYRRHAAEVSFTQAEGAYEAARKRYTAAQHGQRIWEAAVPLRDALRHEQTKRDLERSLELIQAKHAPLLADVRDAANAYADAIRARLVASNTQDRAARDERASCQRRADEARKRALDAQRRATDATGRVLAATRSLEAERASRDVLERVGALDLGEEPVAASDRWLQERELARREAVAETAMAGLATDDAKRHDERAAEWGRKIVGANAVLSTEHRLLDIAAKAADDIAQHPALARALDLDPTTLDVRLLGSEAVRQLREAAHTYLQREVDDRIGREFDERARISLESTELLPPRRDVERVLGVVADLKAGAWSGWTYLSANEPPGGVRAFLRTAPAVADGIVVRDNDYARVTNRLSESDLRQLEAPVLIVPQSAISDWAVGPETSHAKTDATADKSTMGIVVGPNSDAFFSTAAGERELEARRERLATAQSRIEEARRARTEFETVALTLERFNTNYPQRWWGDRRQAILETERQIDEMQTAEADAKGAAVLARSAAAEAEAARNIAEGRVSTATRHVDRISEHLRLHPNGPRAYNEARLTATTDASNAEHERDDATDQAKSLDQLARDLSTRLEEIAGDRRTDDAELRRIQYAASDRAIATAGDVQGLRDRYEQQLTRYTLAVGADATKALLERANKDAESARGLLAKRLKEDLTEQDVLAALETLDDLGLADDRRADAIEEAKSAFGLFGNQGQAVNAARDLHDQTQKACVEIGAVPALSDEERQREPALLDHQATALDRDAIAARRSAKEFDDLATLGRDEIRSLELRATELRSARTALATAWEAYGTLLGQLARDAVPESDAKDAVLAAPFVTPANDAALAEAVRRAQTALLQLRSSSESLDQERQRIVKETIALLTAAAYESVKGPLVADLRRWDAVEYEERIDEVTRELDLRQSYITSLIEQADRHRNTLIDGALHAAEEAVRLLSDAGRQSKVPDHVPGIGGANFLKVTFKVPDDVLERRARLGRLIDELAESTDAIPKGLAFVQRCVQQLARPITVKVLFPDPDREPDYRDVTTIGKFSTGQRLTCATLLYLTLANLRARVRWRQAAPTGVLVCDNPFGKASRASFIEMQREVARYGGIQLIYTTGINDYEALAMLPNVIRLENSRQDRRTGERVLELSVPAGAGRPKRPVFPPGSVGVLEAMRIGRTVLPTTVVRANDASGSEQSLAPASQTSANGSGDSSATDLRTR